MEDVTIELANDLMTVNEPKSELETNIDRVLGTQNDFSPYEAAGRASTLAGRYVREQMLYNYVAKGYIAIASATGVRSLKNGTTRNIKVIERETLKTWLMNYLAPKNTK